MLKFKCSTCGKLRKARNDKFVVALTNDKKEIIGYACNNCERKTIRRYLIKKYNIKENGIPFKDQLLKAINNIPEKKE